MHTHLPATQALHDWSNILDQTQFTHRIIHVIRRKTTTMEIVHLARYDTYRAALDECEHEPNHLGLPAGSRIDWNIVPPGSHIRVLSSIVRDDFSAAQAFVKHGGTITLDRHSHPVAVCVPHGWATRAREAASRAA